MGCARAETSSRRRQMQPGDAFGRTMVASLSRRQCPLKGIKARPDLPSISRRFTEAGWPTVRGQSLLQAFSASGSCGRIEPFDEHEDWALACAHYACFVAVHSPSNPPDSWQAEREKGWC